MNDQFKGICACLGPVPTRGLFSHPALHPGPALGAVGQRALVDPDGAEAGADLRAGLRPFLQAA